MVLPKRPNEKIAAVQDYAKKMEAEANDLASHLEAALAEAADLARKLDQVQNAAPVVVAPSTSTEMEERLAKMAKDLEDREELVANLEEELKMYKAGIENSGGYEMELHRFRMEVQRDRKAIEEERELLRRQREEIRQGTARGRVANGQRTRPNGPGSRRNAYDYAKTFSSNESVSKRTSPVRDKLGPLNRFRAELSEK